MPPQVSIIIPVHNRRAMLREAVDSVRAQRGVSFELIIIDDGSTDGSWQDLHDGALAQSLVAIPSGNSVRLARTEHRGPAAARNRGLRMASAELLAFLDSDDLWLPDKLRHQTADLDRHPEIMIAQTQELWLRDGRRVNPGLRHRKRSGDIFAASLRTCLISPSAAIIRRALLDRVGLFDEQMAACEDYDLWLRITARYPVGLLDSALVIRRAGHGDQLSAITPALDRFRIRALLKLLCTGLLAPWQRLLAAQTLVEKCNIYGNGLARRGRLDEACFYRSLAALAQSADSGPNSEARLREALEACSRGEFVA